MINRKKLLSAIVACMYFFCMLAFVPACAKELKETYHAEMGIAIWTDWPERELLYYGVRSNYEVVDEKYKGNVLSNEKNELSLSVDGCPEIAISTEYYIVEDSTGTVVKEIWPTEEEEAIAGTYFKYYEIKDERGRWQLMELAHTIRDSSMPSFLRPMMDHYQLQRIASEHKILFSSPFDSEYDVEPVEFTINIDIKGESREPVSVRIEDDESFTKYALSNGRDVYVLNYGVEQAQDLCPEIGVYSGETVVMEPASPAADKEDTDPYISMLFRKADEKYHVKGLLFHSMPDEAGVYLASFTYSGDDIYAPGEYVCYIVIPE